MEASIRMKEFMTYAFAEVDRARDEAQAKGFRIIDFGVGDPTDPLYKGAIKGLQIGAEKYARSGYPSYIGLRDFRVAASEWLERRFGVNADPETQITATAGSKEAIFHFPFSVLNQNDAVLMPSIGYPPYKAGTVFAGCKPVFYSLTEENNFLPQIDEIENVLEKNRKIRLVWINYPNNPTTVMASKDFYRSIIELAQKHNVIVASDEAYTEMYEKEKPHSILEFADDWSNIVVFQSLSKRSNATGLRVGFAVGGKKIINYYRKFRTQLDSGVANAIQEAAVYALRDEGHVAEMRQSYNAKRKVMKSALKSAGFKFWADATFYMWVKVRSGSVQFAKRMLTLDTARKRGINVTPGRMVSLANPADADPYVRLALVPSMEDTKLAAEMLKEYSEHKVLR